MKKKALASRPPVDSVWNHLCKPSTWAYILERANFKICNYIKKAAISAFEIYEIKKKS